MADNAPELKRNYDILQETSSDEEYAKAYLGFESEVIDIALIEKIPAALVVVPAGFDWMDVGGFKDLHEANRSDEANNYVKGENIHLIEVENTFVRNEDPSTNVAIIGLDNIVVVNTKDGVLVARKDLSSRVGEIAKKIQN